MIYEKKIQGLFKIFFNLFRFFYTLNKQKDFLHFWPKITYFHILGGQHVHLTPPKCLLEAYSLSCPQNAPHDYPDILEPMKGRVKGVNKNLDA